MLYSLYKIVKTTKEARKRLMQHSDHIKKGNIIKEQKLTFMLICVIVCFFICICPSFVVGIIESWLGLGPYEITQFLGSLFVCLNSVGDFLIYAVRNKQFQKEAMELIRKCLWRHKTAPNVLSITKKTESIRVDNSFQ